MWRLPFPAVKFKRLFISQLDEFKMREDVVFLEAMTTLAMALELTTAAEGIKAGIQAVRVSPLAIAVRKDFCSPRTPVLRTSVGQSMGNAS